MHGIIKLKEMLCRELEDYGEKGSFAKSEIEYLKAVAKTIKSLGEIIEMDEQYSNEGSYRGGSYGSYDDGMSYARGRGRNARRDSMGRYASERGYSRDEDIMELMQKAPEHKKQEIRRMLNEM